HMWTQIVGKIRMAQTPPLNHWWHVPLYVSARGLTTTSMPYDDRLFGIDFDFVDHRLVIEDDGGRIAGFDLRPMSVATFYRQVMDELASLEIEVRIRTKPTEVALHPLRPGRPARELRSRPGPRVLAGPHRRASRPDEVPR